MATMKLDRDYDINGQKFEAGDKVETTRDVTGADGKTSKVDYSDQLKEMVKASEESDANIATHHGAVPEPNDPQEATAQTPTRPLAAPNVAGEAQTVSSSDVENVHEVKDPDGKSANK